MEKDIDNIEIIIEKYVDSFKILLITLLKNKSCDGIFYFENKRKEKKYNYCSHPNYKGKPCKRMVKKVGDLCIFHKQNKEKHLQINNESDNLLNKNFNPFNYLSNEFINEDNSSKNVICNDKLDELIHEENNLLDKKNISFDKLINSSNKKIKEYGNFDDKYISEDKSNILPQKIDLLNIINTENDKLICYKCKKTLITQKEINIQTCDYCCNFPAPIRKKTLIRCKFCTNNTLNINETCRSCYKKQKRKITIFK